SDVEGELRKLKISLKYGADTVMDLSTGGDIDTIRGAIIANSPVPIGTVPIYQVLTERKTVSDIRADDLIDMLEHQAKQGVDYFTIHAGVIGEHLPLVQHRITGIVSGDGLRPGCLADASDAAQFAELKTLGELTRRAWAKDVQVIIEGPGHVHFDQIEMNVKKEME